MRPARPLEVQWRWRFIGGAVFIVLGLVLAWFLAPGTIGNATVPGFTICPFRNFTGLPCPGCGMTRAFHHLVHLEFAEAAAYNILAYWLMGCALIELVNSIVGIARRGRPLFFWHEHFERLHGRILSYLFIATAVIYDLVRIALVIHTADSPADVLRNSIFYRILG
ncbi:MAG: DUF2752 domain-containing protein [Deltaproteobacteria bacterium]|nr:DUF2752 domain-containing protein [Deltaproteobacteria bacterium]